MPILFKNNPIILRLAPLNLQTSGLLLSTLYTWEEIKALLMKLWNPSWVISLNGYIYGFLLIYVMVIGEALTLHLYILIYFLRTSVWYAQHSILNTIQCKDGNARCASPCILQTLRSVYPPHALTIYDQPTGWSSVFTLVKCAKIWPTSWFDQQVGQLTNLWQWPWPWPQFD